MADGVMIQPNPLWNVTKPKIAWMEWGWVAMADGMMIWPNPMREPGPSGNTLRSPEQVVDEC